MVDRFLITTADERTWRTDVPVLFLGEWCRLYDRRHVWEKLDAMVAPYHWDDRGRLFQDYQYLKQVYEKLLKELCSILNSFHSIDHSERYWRIFVGPWLGYFIQVIFDRWASIHSVVEGFDLIGSSAVNCGRCAEIPNDMNDFVSKIIGDQWNSHIYGQILTYCSEIPCHSIISDCCQPEVQRENRVGQRYLSPIRWLTIMFNRLFRTRFLSSNTDFFFISTYLPIWTDLRLQLSVRQFPKRWATPGNFETAPDLATRDGIVLECTKEVCFENFLRAIIPKQIPTIYIEGFERLQPLTRELQWPEKPKLIFTSNAHTADDIFKSWAASKAENGSKIVIGQHGGAGSLKFCFVEEHETDICDMYLNWGWQETNDKHVSLGSIKLMQTNKNQGKVDGKILLINVAFPRYSYWLYSVIVGPQMNHYFQDQFRFCASLPVSLRQQLVVRLYPSDYGWSQTKRWKDTNPDVRTDSGDLSMDTLVSQSRICVCTNNGTMFLETMAQNIPTIIFWNPIYWELRPNAAPYFSRLSDVGILHASPESAAAKIAEIWPDVYGWWNQDKIQKEREFFCEHFVKTPERPLRLLRNILTSISN